MADAGASIAVPMPGDGAGFAPRHKADPYFFAFMITALWAGLLLGFIPEMINHVALNKPAYPWIVHVHGFVFVAWMGLLTTQFLLIQRRSIAMHRRLGKVAYYWAPIMILLGLATAVIVDRAHFGTPDWEPQFLAIQLADLLNFGVLLWFALRMRGDAAAHKRLMILAVIALGNAGYSRWWGDKLDSWLGHEGFVGFFAILYLSDLLMLVLMMAYDLATRMKVHRVALVGGGFLLAVESLSVVLYFNAGWVAMTDKFLRP